VENYTLVKPASWWDTRKTSQQSDAFIYLATLYTHTLKSMSNYRSEICYCNILNLKGMILGMHPSTHTQKLSNSLSD